MTNVMVLENTAFAPLTNDELMVVDGGTFEDVCHALFVLGCTAIGAAIGAAAGPPGERMGAILGAAAGEIIWEICFG